MLNLKNPLYTELAEKIVKEDKSLIVYGAGMIGQIVVPDLLERFQMQERLAFYVDADTYKQGRQITIKGNAYEIKKPEALKAYCEQDKNIVILITNSHFEAILRDLDALVQLDGVDACIIPVMQIEEAKREEKTKPVRASKEMLIPKVIHYCWFSGNEMPEGFRKCIASWEGYGRTKCEGFG